MNQARADGSAKARRDGRESEQQQDRGQREPAPGGKSAEPPGPEQADGESNLAAGGSRKELTQPDQVREPLVVEPSATLDELPAKVADMSDRAAETRQSQPEKDPKNLKCGAASGRDR
ncbi:hypothetical protein BSFA1_50600 [Burkholderia sp. SFA1]|nr:hypothetical protein BSFA1_50600 [Burkholderia sp. SFA1]